jgi:hypothetical protein
MTWSKGRDEMSHVLENRIQEIGKALPKNGIALNRQGCRKQLGREVSACFSPRLA